MNLKARSIRKVDFKLIIRGKIKNNLLKQHFIKKTNKSIFPLLNIKEHRSEKTKLEATY